MRNRLTVTVTDVTGARHFSLSQLARRFIVGTVTAAVTGLLLGGVFIYLMYHALDDVEARRDRIAAEHDKLVTENIRLERAVTERTRELEVASTALDATGERLSYMTDELAGIESLLGLKPADGLGHTERLDVASQTALEKALMLQMVPSGYPVAKNGVTSPFGMRKHPKTGKKAFHYGIDLRAVEGTPVYATADGIVEFAGFNKESGFGNLLILIHKYGFQTNFGHLKSVEVEPGEFVQQGQLVAYTGQSGRATGPHLHYEIRLLERKLDPLPFLAWDISQYEGVFEQEEHVPWDSLAKAIKREIATITPQLSQKEPSFVAN